MITALGSEGTPASLPNFSFPSFDRLGTPGKFSAARKQQCNALSPGATGCLLVRDPAWESWTLARWGNTAPADSCHEGTWAGWAYSEAVPWSSRCSRSLSDRVWALLVP